MHKESGGMLIGESDHNEPPSFNQQVDWEFLAEVTAHAIARVPRVEEAEIQSTVAGLYEVSPDHNAILGRFRSLRILSVLMVSAGMVCSTRPRSGSSPPSSSSTAPRRASISRPMPSSGFNQPWSPSSMSSELFRARRQRVLNRLGDGLLVLPTAPVRVRNGDVAHAFRPGSDFHYLTGFNEPESVLVATRSSVREHHAILFLRPRDPEREIWDGPRLGPRRAVKHLGFDEAYPMVSLYERLEVILGKTKRLFYTLGADGLMDRSLERVFERLAIADYRGNPSAHPVIEDPGPMIATERLVKDRDEIEALDGAAVISAAGHRRAMAFARPGIMEYALQAEVEATFRRLGSRRNGYESIVASGKNTCILHYVSNDRKMRRGELVLLDAGAELAMYTADITRTFPVSGTFSKPQAEIYQIVLRAQKAALRAVSPGPAVECAPPGRCPRYHRWAPCARPLEGRAEEASSERGSPPLVHARHQPLARDGRA